MPTALAGVTYDFGIPGLAVGGAVWAPQSNHIVFPDTGPQRYQYISSTNFVLHMHLGVAYQVFRWMAVGMTFGDTDFATTQRTALSASLSGNPEDPAFAVPIDIKVSDPFTITSNFGLRFTPIDKLNIGWSFTPPYDVSATGTVDVHLPASLANQVTLAGNGATLNVHLPLIMRLGVRYEFCKCLSGEVAFTWEGWNRFTEVELIPNVSITAPALGIVGVKLPVITLPKHYQDAYSARLGLAGQPWKYLTLRAGAFYESSAVRPKWFDLSTPDSNKIGVAAGASIKLWKFYIDLAYEHIFPFAVTVTNSQVTLVNVIPNSPAGGPIGNGHYAWSYDVFHFGVRANFFDGAKPTAAAAPQAPTSEPTSAPATAPASQATP
jgi:long-chain fatty acid transport protein